MLFAFVLILNFLNVLSANSRSDTDVDDDITYTYSEPVSVEDIELLRKDFTKCCQDLKAQAIDQGSLINDIRSIIKSEMESMKNNLYKEISNKIKEELIDVKSKQAENINLVKYTRDGISNLTSEVNSISKLTGNMKNQLYKEFSNKIKEDLNGLRIQQDENINLVKFTSDGLSNLTSEVKSISKLTDSAVNEYRSTTLEMNNEIRKIIPALNKTVSYLESELSTSKATDKIEAFTQNQKLFSLSLNESLGAVYAQLENINLQILNNTNYFASVHEDIRELQIKVNDIRNSSKQTFHLANAFSEKETIYECAEYETFKTKIETSVVEVAKVCSNADTVQRLNDLKSKVTSNANLLNSILQQGLKHRHNIQNTEGDITVQYKKLNDKLTSAMEDKLSKEYLIVKRETVNSNICNTDKVLTAVSELETNLKGELKERKSSKKVISAIRKMETNLKDNLFNTCNGCNNTLQQQLEKVVKLTSATNDLLTPKPLAKPCKNSKWRNAPGDMNVCKEVVKNQLCQGNLKLAFHCCRSCTRAKQLNKDGPHRYLNEPRRIDYLYVILS